MSHSLCISSFAHLHSNRSNCPIILRMSNWNFSNNFLIRNTWGGRDNSNFEFNYFFVAQPEITVPPSALASVSQRHEAIFCRSNLDVHFTTISSTRTRPRILIYSWKFRVCLCLPLLLARVPRYIRYSRSNIPSALWVVGVNAVETISSFHSM